VPAKGEDAGEPGKSAEAASADTPVKTTSPAPDAPAAEAAAAPQPEAAPRPKPKAYIAYVRPYRIGYSYRRAYHHCD
jgi:hypothetical protein